MRALAWAALLVILVAGCSQQPITSSGKPLDYWLEMAKHQDARERIKAVKALGHLGPREPAALPALTTAVEDRDAGVRAEAVLALLNIGPEAREAAPVLEKARRDRDERVRRLAGRALERLR